jgi:5'(3')-deoxyribonucleotidase
MKHQISRIFLDVDGVLADFDTSALKAMEITREQMDERVPLGQWNVNEGTMSDTEFWKRVDKIPDFWHTLGKYPDADEIVDVCEYYFPNEVVLLTTPPTNPYSYFGKAHWIKANFPHLYRSMFIGPNKFKLAHPGAVLVDDAEKNCDKFERAGGKVVLVPTRGNRLHPLEKNRVKEIKRQIEEILSE